MSDSSTPSIVSSIPRTFTFQNLSAINSLARSSRVQLTIRRFLLTSFQRRREKESVQLKVNKYQRAGSKKTSLTQWALFRNNVNFWPAWAFDTLWSANGRLSTFLLEESASAGVGAESKVRRQNLFRANLNWQRCSRSRTKHNCTAVLQCLNKCHIFVSYISHFISSRSVAGKKNQDVQGSVPWKLRGWRIFICMYRLLNMFAIHSSQYFSVLCI